MSGSLGFFHIKPNCPRQYYTKMLPTLGGNEEWWNDACLPVSRNGGMDVNPTANCPTANLNQGFAAFSKSPAFTYTNLEGSTYFFMAALICAGVSAMIFFSKSASHSIVRSS